jgi:anti-sigma factor ChrR (cupin superfamily)
MSYNFERHLDDESLERYAFGRLEETRTELLEEHLLICEGCRTRLDTTEQYIKAMARGSLLLRQQSTPSLLSRVNEWLASFRLPATAWAAAALAICAILYFSTANLRRGGPVLAPVAVSLLAERGP